MCRMSALAATALALCLTAGPVLAAKPDKAAAVNDAASAPRKATPQERAQIKALDPLARAAFWTREANADPADAEAGLQLSQALRQMGNYSDAIVAAQKVAVAQPRNVEAKLEIARANIGRGQGFYAIEPAREAQAMAPRDWRIPSLLGSTFLEHIQHSSENLGQIGEGTTHPRPPLLMVFRGLWLLQNAPAWARPTHNQDAVSSPFISHKSPSAAILKHTLGDGESD